MKIIDANDLIIGRLASTVAKELLAGEEIAIVNAENAVISGSKVRTLTDYKEKREIGSIEHGPHFPKRPDRIITRTVRGMLPYKREKGKKAMSRLKVHVGVPSQFENSKFTTIEGAELSRLSRNKFVKLGEVSSRLGAKF
jgi:large subunit ribosomal protein L13